MLFLIRGIALAYQLSLLNDIFLLHLQQSKSYPGFTLSFHQPQGNKNNDDPGKCFCDRIGSTFLF